MSEYMQKESMSRRANSDPKSSEIRALLAPSQDVFVERPLRKSSVLLSAGGGRMKKAFKLRSLESYGWDKNTDISPKGKIRNATRTSRMTIYERFQERDRWLWGEEVKNFTKNLRWAWGPANATINKHKFASFVLKDLRSSMMKYCTNNLVDRITMFVWHLT